MLGSTPAAKRFKSIDDTRIAVTGNKPEVLFYHLERQPLDEVLPVLIERTLERGWRAVIQAGGQERIDALDALLWTYKDNSFLAHGTAKAGNAALQPVFLTTTEDNPNGATVRFMVDGATFERPAGQLSRYARIVHLFDGYDPQALEQARSVWAVVREAGADVTYWQQSEAGRWEKRA